MALWSLIKETVTEFVDDDAMTLAAALAYYTALGMSPLVVLLLWLATFAGENAQQQFIGQLQGLVGPEGGTPVSTSAMGDAVVAALDGR